MTAPAVAIPHESGELSESQAVERLLAKDRAGKIPKPRSFEEMLDDRDEEPAEREVPVDEPESGADGVLEGDEFAGGDDQPAAAVSGDPLIKFDDGTELALSEVKRGFLRQSDYTRKTTEMAETRKALDSDRATFNAERKAVADRITPLIQQARAIIENPATQAEMNELRQTDPGAYALRMWEMQQRQAAVARLEAEQRGLRETAEREEAEKFQRERRETAERSRSMLADTIPAFKKDFNAEYQKLGKYVLEQGIPAELWDNEVDHRVITLAWKAMQYDAATRKTPETKERLRAAPQTMRPGAAKPPGHAQARAMREATERAHKSGTVDDMVALQLQKLQSARRR